VTPMENGDYFAAWAITTKRAASVPPFAARRRGVSHEYGRLMHFMAQAVKTDPQAWCRPIRSFAPGDLMALLKLGKHFRASAPSGSRAREADDDEPADFLDEWFETDVPQGDEIASGIIGTSWVHAHRDCLTSSFHHYMGELDGVFRAWGFAKGGTGAVSESIASAAARLWSRDPV